MKFLKVHVTRESHSELYVMVPDDFQVEEVRRSKYLTRLGRIAEETTLDSDWDDTDWEHTIRVVDFESMSEEDAKEVCWGALLDGFGTDG